MLVVDLAIDLFAEGDDFSAETIERNRNLYYQKELARQVSDQLNTATSLLTSMLNLHLNAGQNFTVNTAEVAMSLQTVSLQSLTNQSVSSRSITLPTSAVAKAASQSTVSLQVCISSRHHWFS